MRILASLFFVAIVLWIQCNDSSAGIISILGSQASQSATASSKLLPAQEKLSKGDVAECRKLTSRVVAELGDLPHEDVLVAIWLIEKGEYQASQQLLDQLSRVEPDRPDVHYGFAELARKVGRHFDAWTHLVVAESLSPPANWSKKYAANFINAILYSKSLVAEQRQLWSVSKQLLIQLQTNDASGVNVEMGLGRAAFHTKEYVAAEKHFRAASALAPKEIVPELLLASLYAEQQDSVQADAWFVRGETENKLHLDNIRLAHAMWLLSEQRAPDAFRLAQSALNEETKFKDEFSLVQALVYYIFGKYSEAEGILSALSQKNSDSLRISNQLALTLIESTDEGKRARALQIAIKNLKGAPDSADTASSLAWIQFRLGDMQAAEETTSAIIRRGGQLSRDSAYFLSQILLKLNRKKEADTLLEVTSKSKGEFYNAKRLASSNTPKSE